MAEPSAVLVSSSQHLVLEEDDGSVGGVILAVVVPPEAAPGLAELYRRAAADTGDRQSHELRRPSTWAVEPFSRSGVLRVGVVEPEIELSLVIAANEHLRMVFHHPEGARVGVYLFESPAKVDEAVARLQAEDFAGFSRLGVGVGGEDLSPLKALFSRS